MKVGGLHSLVDDYHFVGIMDVRPLHPVVIRYC